LGEMAITVSGDLAQEYTGGKISAVVKFSGVKVTSYESDPCQAYLPDFKCPAPAGAFTQIGKTVVPSNAPAGKYTAQLVLTDSNGNCVYDVTVPYTVTA